MKIGCGWWALASLGVLTLLGLYVGACVWRDSGVPGHLPVA